MKFYRHILPLTAILVLLFISGCSKQEIESPEKIQSAKLRAKTWNIQSVVVDGTDQSAIYAGLTLTFGDGVFEAINGSELWPSNGTWQFKNTQATVIERGDGAEAFIEELTTSGLKISMDWNETSFGPGRKKSIKGFHVLTFK